MHTPRRSTVVLAGLILMALVAAIPGNAGAGTTDAAAQPIAATADSTGPIVVDAQGNGYATWSDTETNENGDPILFCKIPAGGTCGNPLTLPLPNHTTWADLNVVQSFPVLGGASGALLVVGPSYLYSDVVVWSSSNGGTSFGKPKVIPSPVYADDTNVDDVLLSPGNPSPSENYFSIASDNTGLGYTYTGVGEIGASHPSEGFTLPTDTVAGAVAGSTLGFSGKETVEAFWTNSTPPNLDFFWSPLPGVSGSPGTLEHGPIKVTNGSVARLAGGPDGLFLLSEDAGSKASKPLALDVRKWNPTKHVFGAPTAVASIPNNIDASNQGGFTEDLATGALTVAWPEAGPHSTYVMKTWSSTNGGTTFGGPTTVTTIGAEYAGPVRLAMIGGEGFLTYQDGGGLELVDLGSGG